MSVLFHPAPVSPTADHDFLSGFQLPAEPTRALPGSEAKLRVLRQRLRRRESLHHPADLVDVARGWRLLEAIRGVSVEW